MRRAAQVFRGGGGAGIRESCPGEGGEVSSEGLTGIFREEGAASAC